MTATTQASATYAELTAILHEIEDRLDDIPDEDAETWVAVREAILQAQVAVRVLAAPQPGGTLGARVRAARQRRGISQAALARIAGLSKGYVSEIEADRSPSPSADTLYRISSVLETTIEELLGWPSLHSIGRDDW